MQVRQWWRMRAVNDEARKDAQELLMHQLGVSRTGFYQVQDQYLAGEQLDCLHQQWLKREQGTPLPYILGKAWFWGMSLRVSADVLIPRPDTEVLVQALLELDVAGEADVADLGTGSAAIALAASRERPQWRFVGVDRSEAALRIARQNVDEFAAGRVHLVCGSWFDPLKPHSWDVVVSNPPYLSSDDSHLSALIHEPLGALVAGDQGLADLARIVDCAPLYLRQGGWLLLEHGWQQGAVVHHMFKRAGWHDVRTLVDLAGRDRMCLGQWHG